MIKDNETVIRHVYQHPLPPPPTRFGDLPKWLIKHVRISEFNALVNMTADELESWLEVCAIILLPQRIQTYTGAAQENANERPRYRSDRRIYQHGLDQRRWIG